MSHSMPAEKRLKVAFLPLVAPRPQTDHRFMILLIALTGVFVVLAALAAVGLTPDTHREVTQHGTYRF